MPYATLRFKKRKSAGTACIPAGRSGGFVQTARGGAFRRRYVLPARSANILKIKDAAGAALFGGLKDCAGTDDVLD